MAELELITKEEERHFTSYDYEELMDWQFELMQGLIDTSNDIIHREYKDDVILQQGIRMLQQMVLLNTVNVKILERFPDSDMAQMIQNQYSGETRKAPEVLDEEIAELREHFTELVEVLETDFDNIQRRVDGMDTANRIATLNLKEYEDALKQVFAKA